MYGYKIKRTIITNIYRYLHVFNIQTRQTGISSTNIKQMYLYKRTHKLYKDIQHAHKYYNDTQQTDIPQLHNPQTLHRYKCTTDKHHIDIQHTHITQINSNTKISQTHIYNTRARH